MAPMVEPHEERYGEGPKDALVDGGFVNRGDISELAGECDSARISSGEGELIAAKGGG